MERLTIMTSKGPALNITATTEADARKQVHDMFLQVLAAYYEIEERQEKGCEMCEKALCWNCRNIGRFFWCEDLSGVPCKDYEPDNYCSNCGRKLDVGDGE